MSEKVNGEDGIAGSLTDGKNHGVKKNGQSSEVGHRKN